MVIHTIIVICSKKGKAEYRMKPDVLIEDFDYFNIKGIGLLKINDIHAVYLPDGSVEAIDYWCEKVG
jgi:hypothetical protein